MGIHIPILIFQQALTAVIALLVGIYVWRRRSESSGATFLALLMVGISEWALCGAAECAVSQFSVKVWCSKFSYLGINLLGPVWLGFALHFRGRADWLSPRRMLAVCIIPVIIILLAFTNEFHQWVWPTISPISHGDYVLLKYEHGPVYWLALAYAYLLIFAGTILIVQQALRLPKLYRLQSWTLFVAAFIPWATSLVYAMGLGPFPEVDFTPMAFATTGLLMTWNLFSFKLLDVVPIAHGVLFQELPDAVLVTDSQDQIINLNAAAEKWFGISANSSIGSPARQILAGLPTVFERFREGIAGVVEETLDGSDGTRWVDTRVKQLLDRHQRKVGKILVLRDVSEERQVVEALKDTEINLERSRRVESLGVLAGGIAHDFNNLLVGMMGNIDLTLMDTSLPSMHRKNLEAALNASQRAATICQQMLAYSGKGRFVVEPVNLNSVVKKVLTVLQVSIPKYVELRCNLCEPIPAIEADSTQINQVIMNLALNAMEAIGDQNGIITLTTGIRECDNNYLWSPWLQQDLPKGTYVFIEVIDTGCGIPPENLPKIFDPFFTTKFIGRGLGLAAVLGIARGHGGSIKVQSEVGSGSSFQVLFPAARGWIYEI